MTTTSAASSCLCVSHEVVQVNAADFLFSLDEELDVERQAAVLLQMRLDRLDVHEHLTLVVGGAARVNLAVTHRRFEGRAGPQIDRIDWLHVVVPVEENRRFARRIEPVAVDDRIARRVDEPHVLHAHLLQRISRPLRRAAHIGRVLRQRADARDREVLLELLDVPVAVDVDEVDDLIHGSMICHEWSRRPARPSRSSLSRCASTVSRAT